MVEYGFPEPTLRTAIFLSWEYRGCTHNEQFYLTQAKFRFFGACCKFLALPARQAWWATLSSRDRFALRYSCRRRRTLVRYLTEVEATLADLVRRLGPLPATNSSPGAGSAAPAAI